MQIIQILVSLLPVSLFLGSLMLLDSYKLVKPQSILFTIFIGIVVATTCLPISLFLMNLFKLEIVGYSRYLAPSIEETLKTIYLVYLVRSKKVEFMIDSAIYGFAIGTGFALFENVYYLLSLQNANLFLWIIRGFGTAIMHGGATAIFGIILMTLSNRAASHEIQLIGPGLIAAILIHSVFNFFLLPPLISTVGLLIFLPILITFAFNQSEKSLRDWLEIGFDTDMELLELISAGYFSETKIGKYLQSLKSKFPGEMVADMFCLLRIHIELTVRAKGFLMMQQSGFQTKADAETKEKFAELKYLEKNIGKTGKLAIMPFLHTSSRDLWQLYMLGKN